MTPRELGKAMIRRLLAETRADRASIAVRTAELEQWLGTWTGPEDARAAALAFVLQRSYTGLEALLERVVRALDGAGSRTTDWHRELIDAAELEIPQLRPAILPRSARAADELRRFRHFVRHAYAAPLDPARVVELARGWLAVQPDVEADLDDFEAFLEGLARSLDG